MKTYEAAYIKLDGSLRKIKFVKTEDLPLGFLSSKLKGTDVKRNLSEGLQLVWDIENNGFRIFNWKTVQGEIKETETENLSLTK